MKLDLYSDELGKIGTEGEMGRKIHISCTNSDAEVLQGVLGGSLPSGVNYAFELNSRQSVKLDIGELENSDALAIAEFFGGDIKDCILKESTYEQRVNYIDLILFGEEPKPLEFESTFQKNDLLCLYLELSNKINSLEWDVREWDGGGMGDHPDSGPPQWYFNNLTKYRKDLQKVQEKLSPHVGNYNVAAYQLAPSLKSLCSNFNLEKQFYTDKYITSIDGNYDRLLKYTSAWDWMAEGNKLPDQPNKVDIKEVVTYAGVGTVSIIGLCLFMILFAPVVTAGGFIVTTTIFGIIAVLWNVMCFRYLV